METEDEIDLDIDIEKVVNAVLEEEDKKLHLEKPLGINENIKKRIKNLIKE